MFNLASYPALSFWLILLALGALVWKVRKMKQQRFWRLKLLGAFIFWGIIWSPIMLTWSYCNLIKGTGYAMSIGHTGYLAYAKVKNTPKKAMKAANKTLEHVTPAPAKRIGRRSMQTVQRMVALPQEVAYDMGVQPLKPRITLGQKLWRGTWQGIGFVASKLTFGIIK